MSLKVGALAGLIALCFSLLSFAVFLRSDIYVRYQTELAKNAKYCEAEGSAEERYKEEYCQSLLYRTASDPAAFYTAGLLVATLMLFVATWLLYSAAVRQGADAKENTAVARASAEAAVRSANVAEQTLFITQRAYINVTEVRTVSKGGALEAIIKWKNDGRTQAVRCRGAIQKDILQSSVDTTTINYNRVIMRADPTTIGPGAVLESLSVIFSANEVAAAIAGSVNLYVWGWTEYNDVFEGTPRHRIEVCDRLVPVYDARGDLRFEPRLEGPFNGTRDIPRSEEARRPGEEIPT